MGICSDNCNCEVEGDGELVTTGTGATGDAYIVSHIIGRFHTRSYASNLAFPTLTDAELGTVALSEDEAGEYVWAGVGVGWRPIRPPYAQRDVGNVTITAVDPATQNTNGFTLSDQPSGTGSVWGVWAFGYVECFLDPAATQVAFVSIVEIGGGVLHEQKMDFFNPSATDVVALTEQLSLFGLVNTGAGDANIVMQCRVAGSSGSTTTLTSTKLFAQRQSPDQTVNYP